MEKYQRKEIKGKFKEWLNRYLAAEIISTVLSLAAAFLVKYISDNYIAAACAGSIIASISFYGLILYKDILFSKNKYREENRKYNHKSVIKDFRNLLVEFVPSEILD